MTHGNLFEEAKEKKIIYAFLAFFVLEAGMNAIYGYRRGGGGVAALLYAAVFVAMAFVAAWLPVKIIELWRSGIKFWAVALVAPLLFCVLMSQVAGWSALGVTMADGQAKREDKAMQRELTRGELERAQRDLAAITETAPAASLEKLAAEAWEAAKREGERNGCKSVCEQRKREAAAFEERLGKAKRRDELKGVIDASSVKLAKGEAVASGNSEVDVLMRLSGSDARDVNYWVLVASVAIIGFLANFGFAMTRLGGGGGARPAPLPVDLDHAWAFKGASPRQIAQSQRPLALPHPLSAYGVDAPAPAAPLAPSASSHAAPIHINFGPLAGAAEHGGVARTSAAVPAPQSGDVDPAPQEVQAAERLAPSPERAFSPSAPDAPVDRDPMRSLMDGLLQFKAACVEKQDGAVTPAEVMFERYQQWAGDRSIARPAFDALFPYVTGTGSVMLAGGAHYTDVSLRGGVRLASVA